MSLEQIKEAVSQLTVQEFKAFVQWFEEYKLTFLDRQIEADARTGKLDA